MNALYKKNTFVFAFFIFVAAVYIHNLTRDIYSGDIGDLVTAAYVGGVPHPSGYPLFTFLGFIFSHLPFPFPVVARVALVSALSSFIGLILFYRLCLRFSKKIYISLLSTATLAFSYLFWLHAEIPEVFGLNNFFTIAILYTAIMFYFDGKMRYLYWNFFLCALALTHHQTIVLVFPAVLILLVKHLRLIFKDKKHLFYLILSGLAGFIPFIYIPIAASTHPVINWDNVVNFKNFLHLLLRKDYGYGASGLPFHGTPILANNYLKSMIDTYSYLMIGVAILGAWQLFMKNKLLLAALLTSYLLAGPFLIIYMAAPATTNAAWGLVERFYVMSSVILVFFVPFGLIFINNLLGKFIKNKLYVSILLFYFLIVPLMLFYYNYPKTNLSKTQIGNNLAANIFKPIPKNSVLHLYGDTTTFNVWYDHYVLKNRPDVDLIHPPGPGGNQYFDKEINTYYKKHPQTSLKQLPGLTLEDIRSRRPIFSTYELSYVPADSILVPKGLVYELIYKKDLPDKQAYIKKSDAIWAAINPPTTAALPLSDQNLLAQEIPTLYSNSLLRTANFLVTQYQDVKAATQYYKKATDVDETNSGAWASLGISRIQAYGDCEAGIPNIRKAIVIYPVLRKYYMQLYAAYKLCGRTTGMQTVEKYYKDKFKRNIQDDLKDVKL